MSKVVYKTSGGEEAMLQCVCVRRCGGNGSRGEVVIPRCCLKERTKAGRQNACSAMKSHVLLFYEKVCGSLIVMLHAMEIGSGTRELHDS